MPDPNVNVMTSELSKMTASLEAIGDKFEAIADALTASKGIESFEKTTKEVTKPKFEKTVKAMSKMFKSMILAGPKAFIIEKLMMLIEPFINLLDLLSPIFEVLAGIIELALIPVMQELMPIVMEIVDLLMENKDAIIMLIQLGLLPLSIILKILTAVFEENRDEIQELINALIPLLEELSVLAEELVESEEFMLLLRMQITYLTIVVRGLVFAVKMVSAAFETLRGILKAVRDFINTISFQGGGGGGGGGGGNLIPGIDIPGIPGIAGGGEVIKTGLAKVHEGEIYGRPDAMNLLDPEQAFLLERNNYLLEQLVQMTQDKRR